LAPRRYGGAATRASACGHSAEQRGRPDPELHFDLIDMLAIEVYGITTSRAST
jgi:hypothetical protein